ncbi:phage tail protein [Micromonospora wenchangensis]|uniref:phage tail protein n=1 Tax=Micromonospora wenchangensis TaxID=1185415 RepID=UPI0037FE18FC
MPIPTANDVLDYLDGENSYPVEVVEAALTAEIAAQSRVCRVPTEYPADLAEALCRRVVRNLAMRRLPLAVPTGDSEGGPAVLPGRDPEVRRLEAPWRRLVVG